MAQPSELGKAILRTLCYADIFDYPLTGSEIHQFLIHDQEVSGRAVGHRLAELSRARRIEKNGTLYSLKGKQALVARRKSREKRAEEALKIARKVVAWMKRLPTIKMIALTGALAMNNSGDDDDIDLMIVTTRNRLWLSRLLVVPLISLIAKRRKPGSLSPETSHQLPATSSQLPATSHQNSICLNLWLDEAALRVPRNQRNLYTAHEVVQVKPLWNKSGVYEKFLAQNSWIKDYLPNTKIPKYHKKSMENARPELGRRRKRLAKRDLALPEKMENIFEALAFKMQLWYMRRRRTRESVTPHAAFFHPRDTSTLVFSKLKMRSEQVGIKEERWGE